MDTVSVTFLFADPGDSLHLWEQYPEAMHAAVPRFRSVIQQVAATHGGEIFNVSNDMLQVAFFSAPEAVSTSLDAQRALLPMEWDLPLRPRLALLTGSAQRQGTEFLGPAPHRAARLLSIAHEGQILLCHITAELARDNLPEGVSLLDLGKHRLPDLTHPERVFQLAAGGLPSDFPPLRSLDNLPTNLPIQPNTLIGRQPELHAILHQLRAGDVRLLTLTGIGGTGKTRLALQAAADLFATFPDGVYFVALEQLAQPEMVASAVAQALSLELNASQTIEDALQAHLRTRQTLLVLDNFEHLLPAAPLVSILLAACPFLKVLVTSREALHLRGEHEFPVSPLPLPDIHQSQPPESLAQFASVALFIQRARAVRPDFAVDNTSAPAVAEICAYLDGLPLAIELAAARVRLFSPQALLGRLKSQSNLQLLSGGARDLPDRQQTLHKAMQWSYTLLNAEEQALFRRLGVFAGGFTLEAVEAVCFSPGETPANALELLTSLVEKSLVRRSEDSDEQPRFSLLFILQQFALDLMEQEGDLAACRRAHAEYYLALAESLGNPELRTNKQIRWLAVLEQEHDNLRAALGQAINTRNLETAIRLVASLSLFWVHHSHLREGHNWAEQLLASEDIQSVSAELQAKVLTSAASLAYFLGDLRVSQKYSERILEFRQESGNHREIAWALGNLGYNLALQGDTHSGVQFLEESLALFRKTDDKTGLAVTLDKRAIIAVDQDDYSLAQELLNESLVLMQDQENLEGVGWALSGLGNIELYQGNYQRAQELYEECLKISRGLGYQIHTAEALGSVGIVLLLQGNLITARSNLEQALQVYQEARAQWGIAQTLESLAGVAVAKGNHNRAALLFGSAEALREVIGVPIPPSDRLIYDPMVSDARSRMKKDAFEKAWSAGRELLDEGLDKVVAYALEPDEAPGQLSGKESPAGLTSREIEILRLLAQGLADAQIAEKLVISPRTVNAHLTSIYSKLGVNSRAAATRFAVENGIA